MTAMLSLPSYRRLRILLWPRQSGIVKHGESREASYPCRCQQAEERKVVSMSKPESLNDDYIYISAEDEKSAESR